MAAPDVSEQYLTPYLQAAAQHGGGFRTLLWASPTTQRARFAALLRATNLANRSVLDVGCGRADLLDFLIEEGIRPADYIGLEAVDALADAATQRLERHDMTEPSRVIRADFVREPIRMFVGADVSIFSGSLNTLNDTQFYSALRRAYEASAEAMVFNFLCSPALAGRDYLFWRSSEDVTAFARSLGGAVSLLDDYLTGDCTVTVSKPMQP